MQKLTFCKLNQHHKDQCSIPSQAGVFSDSISVVYRLFNSLQRSGSLFHNSKYDSFHIFQINM